MFISAPDFMPELGAGGSAAPTTAGSVFKAEPSTTDGSQLSFPSPEIGTEYMRRCSLRGGVSVDSGGGAVPSSLFGSGPDLPSAWEGAGEPADREFVALMREDLELFWKLSRKTEYDKEAQVFSWACGEEDVRDRVLASAVSALTRGCFSELMEMFRRYPGEGSREQQFLWFESACRLSHWFDRIGIWPLLADQVAGNNEMHRCILALARFLDLQFGSEYRAYLGDEPQAYSILQFLHMALNLESVELHCLGGPDEIPSLGCCSSGPDVWAELERFPVPLSLAGSLVADETPGATTSLIAVALALLGSPRQGRLDDHGLGVLLFAATCLVSSGFRLQLGYPWFSWHRPYSYEHDAQQASVARLVNAAMMWMDANLPRYAFSPEIEEAIESS